MAHLRTVKSFRGTSKTADGNLTCEKCRTTITPGMSYRWWANRLPGSRYAEKHVRCMDFACTPRPSEMAPGRTGEILAIGEGLDDALGSTGDLTEVGDFDSIATDIAQQITSFGESLSESAENMESGFGHETYQSTELRERAERCESAAGEVEGVSFPDPEEHPCEHCNGTGEVDEETARRAPDHFYREGEPERSGTDKIKAEEESTANCDECGGSGIDYEAWRDACAELLQDAWSSAEGEMY